MDKGVHGITHGNTCHESMTRFLSFSLLFFISFFFLKINENKELKIKNKKATFFSSINSRKNLKPIKKRELILENL